MMSRTRVEVLYEGGLSELVPNRTLERIAYEKFLKVGPTPYTQEDVEFCTKIHETFPAGAEESTFSNLSYLYGKTAQELIPQIRGKVINDVIYPYTEIPHAKYGSTDVCDVSWFTRYRSPPLVTPRTRRGIPGSRFHRANVRCATTE